jgi:hypothetical protein
VQISYWDALKKSAKDMWVGLRYRKSIYECYKDPFTRDIAKVSLPTQFHAPCLSD